MDVWLNNLLMQSIGLYPWLLTVNRRARVKRREHHLGGDNRLILFLLLLRCDIPVRKIDDMSYMHEYKCICTNQCIGKEEKAHAVSVYHNIMLAQT